ncbi:MAG: cobalamin-binding protein [Pseudohongiellaceae bacterium]
MGRTVRKLMLGTGLCLAAAWPALASAATPATTIEVEDDDGRQVILQEPARRIVSLAPSLTELLFAAGAGDRVVGVVEYSDYPPPALDIPVIGRYDMLDLEGILALQPDLVVAWRTGNPRASVARLEALGLAVYVAEPRSLASIPDHIEKLARLAGTDRQGSQTATVLRAELAELEARYTTRSPVAVFYQVWNAPLISVGGNELLNDMISLCGGRNIFADLEQVAPKVSVESVLTRNPQVIIASGMDIHRPEWLDEWQRWPALEAVSLQQLHFIPPELVQRHTPRALQGARSMCEQIDQARIASEIR